MASLVKMEGMISLLFERTYCHLQEIGETMYSLFEILNYLSNSHKRLWVIG